MECNECCTCSPFIGFFLSQLLDFGYNCGSLISEAFGLFKTFQKISAPPSFTISFAPECSQMFLWAKNIFDKITFLAETIPLNDFESFSVYTLIIPITVLMYWSYIITPYFYLYCLLYGLFIALGVGFSFLGISFAISFLLIAFPLVIIIMGIILTFCKCKAMCCMCFQIFTKRKESEDSDKIEDIEVRTILFGFAPTFLVLYLLLIPMIINRNRLATVISVSIASLTALYVILYIIFECISEKYEVPNFTNKLISFLTNILSLLIIPSTEKFVELMKGPYSNNWRCILSYMALSLFLPLSITLLNILVGHQSITGKYNDNRTFHHFIELIDIAKQLLYAIFAGYDIIWGCLFLEIAWAVFILIIRPYSNLSEYTLTIGNSMVPCISNSIVLYSTYHEANRINFAGAVVLLIFACLPAIISMFVFFIKDLSFEVEIKDMSNYSDFIGYYAKVITPIAWFFYGLNVAIIDKKVKISKRYF